MLLVDTGRWQFYCAARFASNSLDWHPRPTTRAYSVTSPSLVYSTRPHWKGTRVMKKRITQGLALLALLTTTWLMFSIQSARSAAAPFNVVEATIDGIQKAYKDGTLTAHQLTQMYLDRINAFDKNGPTINSVITVNAKALEEADRLDAEFKRTGKFVGPLH